MNTFGKNVRITFSGASHAPAIGLLVEGLPAGVRLDEGSIRAALDRRRPHGSISTSRSEADRYEILSGAPDGVTDGTPLRFSIPNADTRSGDYDALRHRPRPGHADYPAYVKSGGTEDLRGGGIHSGRMTALFMIAGAIAMTILHRHGLSVGSHVLSVKNVLDRPFDPLAVEPEVLDRLANASFPVLDDDAEPRMRAAIEDARMHSDTVGGIVETAVVGLPAGTGEPLFDSLESRLSSILFSVPAVKAVEFGDGFDIARKCGSEVKDEYAYDSVGRVVTLANHNGGILGGMATGMPLIVRSAVKPTSSIGLPQRTVDLRTRENATIVVAGRHDPAIVHRAVHVINAAVAFALLDLLAEGKPDDWFR